MEAGRDLLAAVDQAVVEHRFVGRTLFVLTSQLPSQILGFPTASVLKMEADELSEAMKYEIETLAGIEIENLLLASRPASLIDDGETRFWVNAIRQTEYQELVRRLVVLGAKSVLVAHPAGLMQFDPTTPGVRQEIWGSMVFEFDQATQRLNQIRRAQDLVGNADPDACWVRGDGLLDLAIPPSVDLSDTETLKRGLASAIKELASLNRSRIPIIQPDRKRAAVNLRPMITALLAVVAAMGCYWHRNVATNYSDWFDKQTTILAQPAADKKQYDAEIVKLLEQQSQLETDALTAGTELKRVQFFLDHQTDRYPKLLKMLIDLRSPEMVIQQLTPDKIGLIVGGIAFDGKAVSDFAHELGSLTTALGWKVSGDRLEGEQKMETGGPWNFQVTLQDIGPADAPVVPERVVTKNE